MREMDPRLQDDKELALFLFFVGAVVGFIVTTQYLWRVLHD